MSKIHPYRCVYCKRLLGAKVPHRCKGNLRKRKLMFMDTKKDDKYLQSLTYNFPLDINTCNGCYFYNTERIYDDKNYDFINGDGDGYRNKSRCDLGMSFEGKPLCMGRLQDNEFEAIKEAVISLSEEIEHHTKLRIMRGKQKQRLEKILSMADCQK